MKLVGTVTAKDMETMTPDQALAVLFPPVTPETRPSFVTDEMLVFLDNVWKDKKIIIFDAWQALGFEFELSTPDAIDALMYWMDVYAR